MFKLHNFKMGSTENQVFYIKNMKTFQIRYLRFVESKDSLGIQRGPENAMANSQRHEEFDRLCTRCSPELAPIRCQAVKREIYGFHDFMIKCGIG